MSGHSKWSTIKHQKGAADAKRGKVFTKLGHAITIAARLGGGDPGMNARLALAIEMGKKANMPKDNIDRAIKRGTGELGGAMAENIVYEGYGPGGTAIMIDVLTDNRNRAIGEIRAAFNKHNGKLGESGSVAYLFKQQGVITIEKGDKSIDDIEMAIIESGAEDYSDDGDVFTIFTDAKQLESTKNALESSGLTITSAELRFEPSQTVEVTDEKTAGQILKLMNALEDIDDVSDVYSNFDINESVLEKVS